MKDFSSPALHVKAFALIFCCFCFFYILFPLLINKALFVLPLKSPERYSTERTTEECFRGKRWAGHRVDHNQEKNMIFETYYREKTERKKSKINKMYCNRKKETSNRAIMITMMRNKNRTKAKTWARQQHQQQEQAQEHQLGRACAQTATSKIDRVTLYDCSKSRERERMELWKGKSQHTTRSEWWWWW